MCATKEHHEVENYLIISEIRYIFKFSLLFIPCITKTLIGLSHRDKYQLVKLTILEVLDNEVNSTSRTKKQFMIKYLQ